jgi:hypothetical protein
MIIDHASTQRRRYTRSSSGRPLSTSSSVNLPLFSHSPLTVTDHGVGLKAPEFAAGSPLSMPNS